MTDTVELPEIFGAYPCCGGDLALNVPTTASGFVREACPHCGAPVWHYLSRLEPQSWTEAGFLADHDVDHDTKTITVRTVAA